MSRVLTDTAFPVHPLFPVHPFDLIYNYGVRFVTGTPPLPRRGTPSHFACGL